MLTARRVIGVVTAAIGVVSISASGAVADDHEDDDVTVSRGGLGWVDTRVVEAGARAAVVARRAIAKPRPTSRTCAQRKSPTAGGYATDGQFASGAPPGAGPGGWVLRRCSDGTLETAWVPAQEELPNPAQLAQRATNRLRLPLPEPRFEPRRASSAGPATLVAIPTWFWIDGWKPVAQRTQAGGAWAEVTAAPLSVTWWPGDRTAPVRCSGPGRAWTSTDTSAAAPCLHTYRRSSAGQPGNVFAARVSVIWKVTWRGSGGLSGELPLMERQSTFPVAVAERQTVVTVGGP